MPVLQMTESQVREMVAALRVMRQATAIIVSTTYPYVDYVMETDEEYAARLKSYIDGPFNSCEVRNG